MVNQDDIQKLMTTDLKIYMDDCFLSTDQLTTAVTQTAAASLGLQNVIIQTGVQEGSAARMNYNRQMFNPLYSKLYFRVRLNSMDDIFMFAGLTTTLDTPEWTKTLPMPSWAQQSHTGIMLHEGTLYFISGDGDDTNPKIQVTPIKDIDMTRWLIYKIEGYKFSWYSLPYTVPYFDKDVLPKLKQGIIRKWSTVTRNGSAIPDDVVHYLTFYVENTAGYEKIVTVQRVNYAEVYPD